MLDLNTKPTWGLALSGSGNRTSFYIGFLEVLEKENLNPDFLSACSGACLVAAAYACGTLQNLKKEVLAFESEDVKALFQKSDHGGLYHTRNLEVFLSRHTKNSDFENVKPSMCFGAVDINSGEKVWLALGNIAKAACVSCTVPGLIEPHIWGGRILVDGGLLTTMPTKPLKDCKVDFIVGVNMRGTKHIFENGTVTLRKVINFVKKFFFWEYLESLFKDEKAENGLNTKSPGMLTVLGKSLDLAIKAQEDEEENEPECDLLITPDMGVYDSRDFSNSHIIRFYELGKETAVEYVPKIKEMLKVKIHA